MDDLQPRPSSSTSNRNGEKRHGKYYSGRKSTDGKINNGRKSASATCIVQTEKMHQNVDLQRPSSSSSAEKIVEIREQQRQEIAAAGPSNKHRHPHPMYLKRKREIDEQFEAAKKRLDTLRDLRLHSLARCMQAEHEAAQRNLDNDMEVVRKQCSEQIELKFEQLEAQEREVKAIMRKEFRLMDRAKKDAKGGRNLRGRGKMRPYLEEIEKSSSNASRKRQNNSNNDKDQQAEAPKFKWRNIPVMIAKLPAKAIDSDLATLFGSPSTSSSAAATVTYDAVDQPSTSSQSANNNNTFINPEVEVS